jgi:hypothetical protein
VAKRGLAKKYTIMAEWRQLAEASGTRRHKVAQFSV